MLVAFLIVFFILAKFGFPVIVESVEKRKKFIDSSIFKANEANKKLEGIKEEGDKIIRMAREEQNRIIKTAEETKQQIISEARETARLEGEKMIESARTVIENEKKQALADIKSQMADLSVAVAEKIILSQLERDGQQDALIGRMIDDAQN